MDGTIQIESPHPVFFKQLMGIDFESGLISLKIS